MMPEVVNAVSDARQVLFLTLMLLLMLSLLLLERRRQQAGEPVAPIIHPPRPPAGPLAWDGPPAEVCEDALFAMAHGDWPAAHRALWESLQDGASDWHYYHLGLALLHEGRLPESEHYFRAAIEVSPDIPEAHYNLGNVLLEMGRWSEAIATFKHLLKQQANYADAHFNLAHVYFQLRMYADAHRYWHMAAQLQPRARDVQANLRFVRRMLKVEQVRKRPAGEPA